MKINVKSFYESPVNDLRSKILYNPNDIKSLIELGVLEFLNAPIAKMRLCVSRKFIHLEPSNVDARFWLGFCLYRYYSDYDQAEKILSEALGLDPARADCLSLLAYINWDRGFSLVDSLAELEKAIHINPDWPMLRIESIYILLNLSHFDAAEKALERAESLLAQVVMTPENVVEQYYENVVTGRAWTNLPERFEKLRDLLVHMKTANLAKLDPSEVKRRYFSERESLRTETFFK